MLTYIVGPNVAAV